MVDSTNMGEGLEGGLAPAEAAPVKVPVVSGVAPKTAPAAVPVEPAPDLGPAQQAVGEAAAAEEIMPAAEPAPIEAPATSSEAVSRMVQEGNHEGLENSLVGDRGPSSEEVAPPEVFPKDAPAIEPDPLASAATVPSPPESEDGVTQLAPKPPAEEGVTHLEPSYAEPLPTAAPQPPAPANEVAPNQTEAEMTPEQAKAEIKRLWDEVINPKSIEYEEVMREMIRTFSEGGNPSEDSFAEYRDAFEDAQKAIARTIELEEKYVRGQEANTSNQVA